MTVNFLKDGIASRGKWWAWVDLNHRPRPYQGSVVRFYSNLQDRGDCQTTRKSCKTSQVVGWVVGWKRCAHIHLLEPRFCIVSGLPTIRPESCQLLPGTALLVLVFPRSPPSWDNLALRHSSIIEPEPSLSECNRGRSEYGE
jgi:hypothetical protein